MKRYQGILLLMLVLVYLFGLNPYLLPEVYDNVVYLSGARSLAEGKGYRFEDAAVLDWPPGLSLLIALPMVLGLDGIHAVKVFLLLFVGLALFLICRHLERDRYPIPTFIMCLCALSPVAFKCGTTILAEWVFMTVSFLFLFMLDRMDRHSRPFRPALLAGILFGVAVLTRHIGLLLGAALIAHVLDRRCGRRPRLHRIRPVVLVALVGFLVLMPWMNILVQESVHAGASPRYVSEFVMNVEWQLGMTGRDMEGESAAPAFWLLARHSENFMTVLQCIGDLFFCSLALMRRFGWLDTWMYWIFLVPGLMAVAGLFMRLSSTFRRPADWYVLSTLIFFVISGWVRPRYLVPISPFLAAYFLEVARRMARVVTWRFPGLRRNMVRAAGACWILTLVAGCGILLFHGSLNSAHSGLCPLVSPTASSFYRGYWGEAVRAASIIRQDPGAGAVAAAPSIRKYVHFFTGRRCVDDPREAGVDYFVCHDGKESRVEAELGIHLDPVFQGRWVSLYRTGPSPLGHQVQGVD